KLCLGARPYFERFGARRQCLGPGRGTLRLRPLCELSIEQTEVTVADRDDVLAHDRLSVFGSHAIDAGDGNVDRIARRLKPAAEHPARYDRESDGRACDRCDEFTPCDAG